MIYGGPKKGLFLFDSNTRVQGGKDQHVVTIQDIDGKPLVLPSGDWIESPFVAGFLKNQFTYSVDAEWSPILDNFVSDSSGIAQLAQVAGSPIFQSGLFKRKFYKGAGYISFDIEMRIISDTSYELIATGENNLILNPKTAVQYLSTLCLPDPDPILGTLSDFANNPEGEAEKIKTKVNNVTKAIEKSRKKGTLIEDGVKKFGEFVGKQYPRTVRVKIGNYFDSSDMLIEKVTATYSKESIKSGEYGLENTKEDASLQNYQPLWVDLSISVSTKTIPTVDEETGANTGLLTPQPSVSIKKEVLNP